MSPLSSRVSHTVATWPTVNDNVGSAKTGAGTIGPLAEGAVAPVPAGATADISSVSIIQDPSRSRIHLCSVSAPTGSTSKHRCHRSLLLSIGLKKLSDSICVCSSRFSSCLPSVSEDCHYSSVFLFSITRSMYRRMSSLHGNTEYDTEYVYISFRIYRIGAQDSKFLEVTRPSFRSTTRERSPFFRTRSFRSSILDPPKFVPNPNLDENVAALSIIPRARIKPRERD